MAHIYLTAGILSLGAALVTVGLAPWALFLTSLLFLVACLFVAGEKAAKERT